MVLGVISLLAQHYTGKSTCQHLFFPSRSSTCADTDFDARSIHPRARATRLSYTRRYSVSDTLSLCARRDGLGVSVPSPRQALHRLFTPFAAITIPRPPHGRQRSWRYSCRARAHTRWIIESDSCDRVRRTSKCSTAGCTLRSSDHFRRHSSEPSGSAWPRAMTRSIAVSWSGSCSRWVECSARTTLRWILIIYMSLRPIRSYVVQPQIECLG